MKILNRIKFWLYITKAIFRGQPVRTWIRLDDQSEEPELYMCDGDCGRFSLHGVCTCGLSHFFKPEPDGYKKVARDNVSWCREYTTIETMRNVPYRTHCNHGTALNDKCHKCTMEIEALVSGQLSKLDALCS